MKVLVLPEPGKIEIRDAQIPELEPEQAVVKIELCGICGSDITAYKGVILLTDWAMKVLEL